MKLLTKDGLIDVTVTRVGRAVEPSHDPTDRLHDAIDGLKRPTAPTDPIRFLAYLFQTLDISADERDAGEIFHRIAARSIADISPSARHNVPWKSEDGKWSVRTVTRAEAKTLLDVAMAAIKSDRRRRAVMLALGARESSIDWERLVTLVAGLEDLARFWIGGQQPTQETIVNRLGVTMPKILGDNDATPERLAKAENDNDLAEVNGARRMDDWPFERMRARRQLDRNHEVNETLYAAGLRYFQDWNLAGMSGIATPDLARPMVDGGKVPGGTMPERRMARMQSFSAARRALGPRYWRVIDPVVIEGRSIADIRHDVTGLSHNHSASAAAIERLNAGLRRLAAHYGLMREAA
jgi:hypothetical protein